MTISWLECKTESEIESLDVNQDAEYMYELYQIILS